MEGTFPRQCYTPINFDGNSGARQQHRHVGGGNGGGSGGGGDGGGTGETIILPSGTCSMKNQSNGIVSTFKYGVYTRNINKGNT